MKTMLAFLSVILLLITLCLLVPMVGAQESEDAEDQAAIFEDDIGRYLVEAVDQLAEIVGIHFRC